MSNPTADPGILPGAMPGKNRHSGNPILSGIGRLLFRAARSLSAMNLHRIFPLRLLGFGLLAAAGLAAQPTPAEVAAAWPPYRPHALVSGRLVFWGDDAFDRQMPAWAAAFRRFQPGLRLRWFLKGSSTAVGALYTGTAQIGFLGREIRPLEIVSWKRIFPYPPLVLPVATGGFDVYNGTNSAAILVNARNPLRRITLAQIDAIYSHDRRRGAPAPITTWGGLGLGPPWADRPITVYGLVEDTGTAQFLQARVLEEGRWSYQVRLAPGAPAGMYQGSGNDTALRLERALASDPYAIGLGTIRSVKPGIKALAVGRTDAGPFVADTRETTLDRTYPLARLVYVAVNQDPNGAWDPRVREFLSFLFSREGQSAVANVGFYFPLPARYAAVERARLR